MLLVIPHPQYNIDGLRHKNVKEFYDYDIALVKVEEIKPSWTARWVRAATLAHEIIPL